MPAEPVRSLKFQELQRVLHQCARHNLYRHALRKECLRRAQAWGRLANYAGAVILFCLALVVWHQLTQ